jgi:hypothetical protein
MPSLSQVKINGRWYYVQTSEGVEGRGGEGTVEVEKVIW